MESPPIPGKTKELQALMVISLHTQSRPISFELKKHMSMHEIQSSTVVLLGGTTIHTSNLIRESNVPVKGETMHKCKSKYNAYQNGGIYHVCSEYFIPSTNDFSC